MRAQALGRGAVARLMTAFNCHTAHASFSSPHLLLPRLLLLRSSSSSSYYSILLPSRHRRQFASDSSPAPGQSAPPLLPPLPSRLPRTAHRCSSFCRTRVTWLVPVDLVNSAQSSWCRLSFGGFADSSLCRALIRRNGGCLPVFCFNAVLLLLRKERVAAAVATDSRGVTSHFNLVVLIWRGI
jgi:hypothetical protein